jgi:glycosyltransferase involved in cell wall biosynthesis
LDNVYFLPAVRFDNIFKYMIELDIGIMPYSLSGHAGYCESPLKMYQYWLCGLPIVSSQLPNVVDDPKLISCASNISDWLSSLENQLVNDSQQMRQYRKQVALDNSWEKKASKIIRLISEL